MKPAVLVLATLMFLFGCGGGVTDKGEPASTNPSTAAPLPAASADKSQPAPASQESTPVPKTAEGRVIPKRTGSDHSGRKVVDFAGKWKSDRFELNLKPDGEGSGIDNPPSGGFTAEHVSLEEKDGAFVLSFLRTENFNLRKWKLTLNADQNTLEMAEIGGTEKSTLKKQK